MAILYNIIKHFLILGPHMVTLFNTVGTGEVFARDTLSAHITVLHKEGKDQQHVVATGPYHY